MTRKTSSALLAACLLASACRLGVQPQDFPPAMGPAGARITLHVRGEDHNRVGELYAVDSVGVFLMTDHLVRVYWPRVYAMDVDKLGSDVDVSIDEPVSADKRARLALITRFPQGISSELMSRIMTLRSGISVEELK